MSNETKWTQGEWYTREGCELSGIRLISVYYPHGFLCSPALVPVNEDELDSESWLEARKRTSPERRKAVIEHNANAHLIAAAPDLYAALNDTVYDLEQCEVLIDSIRGSGRGIREIEQDDDLPISIIEARKVLAKARGQQCE